MMVNYRIKFTKIQGIDMEYHIEQEELRRKAKTMTGNNKNTSGINGLGRNAAEPFIIRLTEEPYLLSREMLQRDTDKSIQRKRDWYYPKLDFISLNDGTLKLNNTCNDRSYEMTVFIQPTELHISCNCGTKVETICLHSYKALERLTWIDSTLFFKEYQPGGLVEISTQHGRYFNIKSTEMGLEIKPKSELGMVYYLSGKLDLPAFNHVCHLPGLIQKPAAAMKNTALIYILADNYKDRQPPFLLPCIGYLNKVGTDIKWFDDFISGTQKKYDEYLTQQQRTLNLLCYEMWQLAEELPGSLISIPNTQSEEMNRLFHLWQQVFPLLQNQQFVFRYGLFWKKELKRNPSKQRLDRIEIRTETPALRFILSNRGDIYQLQLQFLIKGTPMQRLFMEHLFFVRYAETMYMLSSLRDAGIVEWMDKNNNCITIFKEHFGQFEQEMLKPLQENYFVEIVRGNPLRITPHKKSLK